MGVSSHCGERILSSLVLLDPATSSQKTSYTDPFTGDNLHWDLTFPPSALLSLLAVLAHPPLLFFSDVHPSAPHL